MGDNFKFLLFLTFLTISPVQVVAKNNLKLWRFPTELRFLTMKKEDENKFLITVRCVQENNCQALQAIRGKKKAKKSRNLGGKNLIAKRCVGFGGKYIYGNYKKNDKKSFCRFKDDSIIEASALRLVKFVK